MTDSESTTKSVVLNFHNPIQVLDELPVNVFPTRMKVSLPRRQETGTTNDTYQTPDYPVSLQQSTAPYIPDTTVYFDNPASRPPGGEVAWSQYECQNRLTELSDYVDEETANTSDLRLAALDVVTVPDQYLTTDPDTGDPVVKPDLYKRNGEMRIASFEKDSRLTATDVREDLDEALPGESRTPIQLVRVEEVHAKPQRRGRTSQFQAGRAQYYTETDASQVDDLSLTPAIYELQARGDPGDRTRPLEPMFSELDAFLPELTRSDSLLNTVTFVGEQTDKTVFRATGVR